MVSDCYMFHPSSCLLLVVSLCVDLAEDLRLPVKNICKYNSCISANYDGTLYTELTPGHTRAVCTDVGILKKPKSTRLLYMRRTSQRRLDPRARQPARSMRRKESTCVPTWLRHLPQHRKAPSRAFSKASANATVFHRAHGADAWCGTKHLVPCLFLLHGLHI